MPIIYKPVPRWNPARPDLPPRYHAQQVSTGSISLRQLAKLISERATVKTADTMAVLEGMLEVIPAELGNGKIIRLGDFGTFSASIKSDGAETEDKLRSTHINKVNIRFRPGTEFQQMVNNYTFRRK